jgi:DNA polymerase sigma
MTLNFSEHKAQDFLHRCNSLVASSTRTSKKLADLSQYEKIRDSITCLASRGFGSVDVYFFGSRIIGVASEESDMDIFVDTGGNFNSSYASRNDAQFQKFASALSLGRDWLINKKVLRTRVPIVIAVYRPLGLNCKIQDFIAD